MVLQNVRKCPFLTHKGMVSALLEYFFALWCQFIEHIFAIEWGKAYICTHKTDGVGLFHAS